MKIKGFLSLTTDFAHRLPLTCGSLVKWLGLKTIFSLSELLWLARQTYNNCGGVTEEAVVWKTRVGSPKIRVQKGMGCGLCSKAVWWWVIAKMASLSSPFLLTSSFLWVGPGNCMVTRWVFWQISLQIILRGEGKEEERFLPHQPAESTCPVAVWLGAGQ